MHTCEGKRKVGAANHSIGRRRRDSSPLATTIYLAVAAVLLSAIDYGIARSGGMGFGVLAAPCENATTGGGEGRIQNVEVTATTNLDLTSIFACEGGTFVVAWLGAVNVSGTIHIGVGTTVTIVGDTSPNSTGDAASSMGSSNITAGGGNSSIHDEVDVLTGALSIPRGLTSAVVGAGSSTTSVDTDESLDFGPIFFVDGGQLILENMAVRGGFVLNSTENSTARGAGIHAQHSNITVTGCEFEDNFAELYGGGIFGNYSTLSVVDSVFRRCRAGFRASAGDDVDSNGGGIGVSMKFALPALAIVDVVCTRMCTLRFSTSFEGTWSQGLYTHRAPALNKVVGSKRDIACA